MSTSSRKRKKEAVSTSSAAALNIKALTESQQSEKMFISWQQYCEDSMLQLPLDQLVACDLVRECRQNEVAQLADHMKQGLVKVTFRYTLKFVEFFLQDMEPIIVRRSKTQHDTYEIIEGNHR
jgi:hypothetical protein